MAVSRSVLLVVVVISMCTVSTECARQVLSSPWLSYWHQKLQSVQVPISLTKLASPLTSAETSAYVRKLQSGSLKVTDGQSLCRASNMLCGEKAQLPIVCSSAININYGHINGECSENTASGVLFDQRTLVKGNKILYPKLDNDLGGRTFLPADLAKAMPFSKSRLSEEYMALNVPSDSNMAQSMKDTLSLCESAPLRGEIRTCHSSIESIVDFAASNMGTKLIVLSPEYTSSQSQQVTIRANPVTLSSVEQSSMSCHDLAYPYLVYGCHVVHSSQIQDVELETDEGSSFHAAVICHTDTSSWDEGHPAFKALGVKPGEASICHWVGQNNFIWIHAK